MYPDFQEATIYGWRLWLIKLQAWLGILETITTKSDGYITRAAKTKDGKLIILEMAEWREP